MIEICKFYFQSCTFWADEFSDVRTQGMHCHIHSSGLHYAFLASPFSREDLAIKLALVLNLNSTTVQMGSFVLRREGAVYPRLRSSGRDSGWIFRSHSPCPKLHSSDTGHLLGYPLLGTDFKHPILKGRIPRRLCV